MAQHNEVGKLGEQLAAKHLLDNDYEILARNWRVNRAEIDIIARQGETLIFVEVKTRSSDQFAPPEISVTKRKKRLLASAAGAYMQEIGHEWAMRFDVISVVMQASDKPKIVHFEDAFFPGLHE